MNDQLILKFPSIHAYKKEDFYVSSSNQEAYDFINAWPKWIKRTANIYGPSGSGKSHLSSILKNKTACLQIESNHINDDIFFKFKTKEALIIENLTEQISEKISQFILTLDKYSLKKGSPFALKMIKEVLKMV